MLNKINALVASIYFQMCIALIVTRFWTFVLVSFRIYTSAPGVWGLMDEIVGVGSIRKSHESSSAMDISSVNHLKNKVVLLYGVVEMMFCFWVSDTYFAMFPVISYRKYS
jgi:fumarate reductase subunit C